MAVIILFPKELASWEEANTICNSSGGYLASISSEEENDFISSLLNLELEDGWMGLTDYLNEGDWVWSNGELYEYNNWANNEPGGIDAANNYENYGLIHISGTWNDGYALTDHQYIMEIDAIYGCLDSEYYNYNSQANTDNGICMSYEEFIIDSLQQALAVFEPIQESQGYSMSFDGDDDYIRIEHNETLNLLSNMTVMSWVKLSENYNDHNTIIAKRDDSIDPDGEHPWQLTTSLEEPYNQAMFCSAKNNSYTYSNSIFPIFDSYEWVNIASVVEGDSVKFYKNGIYISTNYFPASNRTENNFDILIGSVGRSEAEYFMGKLDEVLLFDFALSNEEIQSYISCTPVGTEEGLVGYWNFNNGLGDTVYDISGNGNHGIICGGAEFSEDIPESFNGCTDANALNYDETALCDNSSCVYGNDIVSNLEEELSVFETVEEDHDYCTSFDGVDDYIELNQFDNVFSNFSFSTEIYIDEGQEWSSVFWIGDESTSIDISKTISLGIQSHSNNPKLYFNLNFDNGVVSSDFEYNTWINVIGIFRGASNKISLYIDGNLVSEQTSNVSYIDLSNLDQASINTIGNGFGNMNNLENHSVEK